MHDSSVGDTSMKLCTDDLHMSLIDNQPLATKKFNVFKMATPKIRPKTCFSFITENALILTPINVLKLNIKLGILDISVPSTCLYLLRFLRYSI